jgi:large-conductance mechanosensitive channel
MKTTYIEGQIINSILNILIQQTLINMLNLSSNFKTKFTCQYEQLQLIIMNQIFIVSVIMFTVINQINKTCSKTNFGGLYVIVSGHIY